MKYAADFRRSARDALRGKWIFAVVVGLVAVLLGGTGSNGPEIKLEVNPAGAHASLELSGQTIYSVGRGFDSGSTVSGEFGSEATAFLVGSAVYIMIAAIVLVVIYFILGSVVSVGYARFNLQLVDGEKPAFEPLFRYFSYWKTAAVARLLQSIYVLLWSLLLVIPGIVATYSYAMTNFILAEHPELTASQAIARSKEMMYGNRLRLFCLHFSFIGWRILCVLTAGIGNLWLTPYTQAANAAFYREISGSASGYIG